MKNNLTVFEGNNVEIVEIESKVYFELYSTGMALGYINRANNKNYPHKVRINKVLKNGEIEPFVHGVQKYLDEEIYMISLLY